MHRSWTRMTAALALVVGLGLSACAEPAGYVAAPAPVGYDDYPDDYPYAWVDGGWGVGRWEHDWRGHGFAHGPEHFGEHGGFGGHGGFGAHGGGGHGR
jgi:hypothetical protein